LVSDLLIAPYLPVAERVQVGAWELLPLRKVEGSDVVPTDLRDEVSRLVEAYRLPSGGGAVLGVLAYPFGGKVGEPFERSDVELLGDALLAGVVADNPRMALAEDEQSPNIGQGVSTAENALLFGHPLGLASGYVIETGVILKALRMRSATDGRPLPKVEPPVELPRPLFGSFDQEVASAAYALMLEGTMAARRLQRSLDWYRVCLSNAEAVSSGVRVAATRTALEVLTGAGDESKKLVRAVGNLLREDGASEQTRSCVFWKGPVVLSDDEWWLARLCELRNSIVHGDELAADTWIHDGHHHLDYAHDALVRCLKVVVAEHAEDPLLKLTRSERAFPRAHARAERHLQELQKGEPD
jgi:hypothetical protein